MASQTLVGGCQIVITYNVIKYDIIIMVIFFKEITKNVELKSDFVSKYNSSP